MAIHSMIRVRYAPRSRAFYEQSFAHTLADRLDYPEFTLLYLSSAQAAFEPELTSADL